MLMREMRLTNFRGFKSASIELRPITVLLGPNSSGKSSFGHALAAMTHAHKYYAGGPQASLTPLGDAENWPVDLGTTSNLRTDGESGPVKIGLLTSAGWVEFGFGGISNNDDRLDLSFISHPVGDQSTGSETFTSGNLAVAPGSVSGVGAVHTTTIPLASRLLLNRENLVVWKEGPTDALPIIRGLVLHAVRHETGTARQLANSAVNELAEFFDSTSYLRASRRRPMRRYDQGKGKQQAIGYAGEWLPSILYDDADTSVAFADLPALPRSAAELPKQGLQESRMVNLPLSQAVAYWLRRLNLASEARSIKKSPTDDLLSIQVSLPSQGVRDITEIGFGISQILPVLVAGLLQRSNSLFIVDLPEAHLHPRPQGGLAEFFCSLALAGKSCLIETHSQLLFQQLRVLCALYPQLQEMVAVYFLDQANDAGCCEPRRVGLGLEDEMRWPIGFFQEAFDAEALLFTLAQRARRPA